MRLLFGFIALWSASAAAGGGVEALRGFYESVDSLAAEFRQVQVDEAGETVQEAAGTFLLARPDRFRWAYREPFEQIIVSDGKAFRFYDVDLAQVTIRDVSDSLQATPAQLLAGGAALEDAFDVTDAGNADGLDWVRLKPRGEDSDFEAIRIGLDDSTPVRMELDDRLGQTTRIRFTDIRTNVELAGERFTLELPDDVTVVDGRGEGN